MSELTRERGLPLLNQMIRIRRFEEKCAELYSAGKIRGFLHLYVGEEAIATGVLDAVQPEARDEAIVSTYREHGHALARGVPMRAVLAEMYGKVTGCSRGRGGSMHLFDVSRRFMGGNAIVAGGIPLAVGMALADRMLKKERLTLCFFGDGAVAEGAFHESLNLASLWKLPVLFLCENNRYAMGTALEREHAQTNLSLKASAQGIQSEQVDGMDVLAVIESTRHAAEEVRNTGVPRFIEFLTYRFRAHSMYDPELYRSKEEVRKWRTCCDPIQKLAGQMLEMKLIEQSDLSEIERDVDAEIIDAIQFAEESPWEADEDLLKNVYTEGVSGRKSAA